MSPARPDWATLNAYVDGELSAAQAATVARALAEDRALAREVATLSRLKAVVQDGAEAADVEVPAARPRRRAPAIAASVALLVVLGAALVFGPWQDTRRPAWLAAAWAAHAAWAEAEPPAGPAPIGAGALLATLARFGASAYLPDLEPGKLTLSRLAEVALADGGRALLAGYRGTRGCRVSLLILERPEPFGQALARHAAGPATAYAWRTQKHGYVLLAEGMDSERLALLAETVRRASIEHRPFDAETRTALRESRRHSVPCAS